MHRPQRIIIADDSVVFRTQIRKVIESIDGVEAVGAASNGRIALQMLTQHSADLLILDMNMPEMDGLETLRQISALKLKVKVIVFASATSRSARQTLEALSLGADDFVLKPEGGTLSVESAYRQVEAELKPRICQFIEKSVPPRFEPDSRTRSCGRPKRNGSIDLPTPQTAIYLRRDPEIVVIASSTGGPAALECLFQKLIGAPAIPILIVQHMPEKFTMFLARRLAEINNVKVREAEQGDEVSAGTVLIAPGNFHMRCVRENRQVRVRLDQGPKVNSVRPAADLLFQSAVDVYGDRVAGIVLTGMGSDGCQGAQKIKHIGGQVLIQDRDSSVVWGMPGAVYDSGSYDAVVTLEECGDFINNIQLLKEGMRA